MEARRPRWAKVLFHLWRIFNSQRYDHQLKHRWADLVAREQDLLDHLGVVIGGPVAANMNAQEIREFQRKFDVEAGFHNMARQYRHERATGASMAFSQGGPALPTTATTTTA
ncbi:hypothetical protein NDU88_011488 [Pleurodeles waltl]|uniref:Uncharacterized protein n=1 Tax=Pleurodeles waltl TaxID=8319 RepID=A0AAV7S518_PLEWA|nr:hypothetical protein NDU88_011488 [Pleurodeles waltl]